MSNITINTVRRNLAVIGRLISNQRLNNKQINILVKKGWWWRLIFSQNVKQGTISLIIDYIYEKAGDSWDNLYRAFAILNDLYRKIMTEEQKQKTDEVLNKYHDDN